MPKFKVAGTLEIEFETTVDAEDQDEAEEIVSEMGSDSLLEVAKKVTLDFVSTDEIG